MIINSKYIKKKKLKKVRNNNNNNKNGGERIYIHIYKYVCIYL